MDFSRYVALGDSVTAGYKDGALFYEGQMQCYPLLLARQFGCAFRQPLVDEASVGIGFFGNSRMVLRMQEGYATPQLSFLAGRGDASILTERIHGEHGPFNNLGVPGAKVITLLAPSYGNSKLGEGRYNPFFSRFCSKEGTSSVLEEAMAIDPTFFSLFIGNNDALAYALSGGTMDAITPLEGPPGTGFEASMNFMVDTLMSRGAKGAVSNLPALRSIPFFNTIRYDDLLLDNIGAQALQGKFRATGIKFSPGRNAFLVEDHTTLSGIRQMTEGELVSIDILLAENKNNYLSGFTPLPKNYYLSKSQVEHVERALSDYNHIIKKIAAKKELAFVDTNRILKNVKVNWINKDDGLRIRYKTGGLFSLDGLHINSLGQALLANEFVKAINRTYATDLRTVNLTKFREHIGVKWGDNMKQQ